MNTALRRSLSRVTHWGFESSSKLTHWRKLLPRTTQYLGLGGALRQSHDFEAGGYDKKEMFFTGTHVQFGH